MKNIGILTTIVFWIGFVVHAQQTQEVTKELSKKASKGLLSNSYIDSNGDLVLSYKMKIDKKSDEVKYEDYIFDANLNFKKIEEDVQKKQERENKKLTILRAFVGGGNSFNVMSMNLSLKKEVWERNWDYTKQCYVFGKRLSSEVVKPRNSEGKYKGYAAYWDDDNSSIFVVGSADTGEKDNKIQFLGLYVDSSLNLKETVFPLNGNYSLVYSGELLDSGNVFAIFAPNKGAANTSAYVYIEVTKQGNIVYNSTFNAPSPAMAVMGHYQSGDQVYMIAGSVKKATSFDSEFSMFAPINNPNYYTSSNSMMDKYEKKLYKQEFEKIHLLRFEKGKLVSVGSTLVKDMKSKVKTPPSQKKATPYKGGHFSIQNFFVAPNGDCLVTGQLDERKIVNGGEGIGYFYRDIVCLHFDNNGELKAQYAVERMYEDSKSEIFEGLQNFFLSEDRNTLYWEILEVKGMKGYASIEDAFKDKQTFTANYFPRMAKIDLRNNSISDFKVFGDKGKYSLYLYHSFLYEKNSKTRYYIGHDKNYKQLWLGKVVLE